MTLTTNIELLLIQVMFYMYYFLYISSRINFDLIWDSHPVHPPDSHQGLIDGSLHIALWE